MKHAKDRKPTTPQEAVFAIQHANVCMVGVVAAACVGGRWYAPAMEQIGDRIMEKSRNDTDAALGERMADKTTWADMRAMMIAFHKNCLAELEAANK